MNAAVQSDAEFYTLVHYLRRSAAEAKSADERRRTKRRPFATRQWIALVDRGATPLESDFESVECVDISTGGFSFLYPRVPAREHLSVRLGLPGEWLYVSAQVAHCATVEAEEGEAVMVGCKFLARE